jgi:ankyrin repeat protein
MELLNEPINQAKNYNALGMAVYYGNCDSVKALLKLGADIDLPSSKNQNSPLNLAAIRNKLKIFELLLNDGADTKLLNAKQLNCLDNAILNCNYEIAYTIMIKTNLHPKSKHDYIELMKIEKTPFFNLPLFYEKLIAKCHPREIPFFNFQGNTEKSEHLIHDRIRRKITRSR